MSSTYPYTICWLVFLWVGFSIDLYGQASFSKTYPSIEDTHGKDVIQTSDGGYLIVGDSAKWASGNTDIYLIKTDETGELEWTKTLGWWEYADFVNSVIPTLDGGYLIGGGVGFPGITYGSLYKLDSLYNVEWSRDTIRGIGGNSVSDMVQLPDSNYLITGSMIAAGAIVYKMDTEGQDIWRKYYSPSRGIVNIEMLPDSNYIMLGVKSSGSGNVILWKIDSEGNLIWEDNYGTSYNEDSREFCITSDSCIAITGYAAHEGSPTEYDVFLMKISFEGDSLWTKYYGDPTNNDEGVEIIELPNKELLVYSEVVFGMITKFSSDGDSLWSTQINKTDAGGMCLNNDSNIVLTGSLIVIGVDPEPNPAFLIVTDSLCEFEQLYNSLGEITDQGNGLSTYPNPFSTSVVFQLPENGDYSLRLYDINGREVQRYYFSNSYFELHRNGLPSGMYFYQLENNSGELFRGKIVAQ